MNRRGFFGSIGAAIAGSGVAARAEAAPVAVAYALPSNDEVMAQVLGLRKNVGSYPGTLAFHRQSFALEWPRLMKGETITITKPRRYYPGLGVRVDG